MITSKSTNERHETEGNTTVLIDDLYLRVFHKTVSKFFKNILFNLKNLHFSHLKTKDTRCAFRKLKIGYRKTSKIRDISDGE